jgi:5-methylcytosine-specific restriction protein A
MRIKRGNGRLGLIQIVNSIWMRRKPRVYCAECRGGCKRKERNGAMPRKPKHPCGYRGCPKLVDGRYCDEHQRLMNAQYEKYDRDPATKRRYGRVWRRIRDRYIKAHPLCEECARLGTYTPAEEVHHIKPLSHSGTHSTDNLMSLCKSCHSRFTALEGDRWGRSERNDE